jgi:hypothetical protein
VARTHLPRLRVLYSTNSHATTDPQPRKIMPLFISNHPTNIISNVWRHPRRHETTPLYLVTYIRNGLSCKPDLYSPLDGHSNLEGCRPRLLVAKLECCIQISYQGSLSNGCLAIFALGYLAFKLACWFSSQKKTTIWLFFKIIVDDEDASFEVATLEDRVKRQKGKIPRSLNGGTH